MDSGAQNINSFHLAGVVPTAGQPLDYEFPWHDSMMPLAPSYLAIHHAVMECAWAGCETIWIVCHHEMQPLIRYELGEYIQDPVWFNRKHSKHYSESRKVIPIYYVSIHPSDRAKRDCLGWSALYGANTAYWTSRKMSKWLIPDKYYVSFPYGIYDNTILRKQRKFISSANKFYLTFHGNSIKSGLYLGFTFDGEDFKTIRDNLRKSSTGLRPPGHGLTREVLPIEERWSARHFSLDKVFENAIIDKDTKRVEVDWYHGIDNWDSYCELLGSPQGRSLSRPYKKILKYNELNPIGVDNSGDD